MTNTEWLRERCLARVIDAPMGVGASIQDVLEEEWDKEFERLMRNRLGFGRFRYGPMRRTSNLGWDRIASVRARLKQYEDSGNQECLVDAANLLLLEFRHGAHPNKHFHAVDDGPHVRKTING